MHFILLQYFLLFIIKNANNDLLVHIHSMQPDAMDVGSNLEESLCYLQFHQEVVAKLEVP